LALSFAFGRATEAALISAFLLFTNVSFAQEVTGEDYSLDIERFRPASDTYGYGTTHSATTLQHLQLGSSVWVSYSNDPVVMVWEGQRVLGTGESDDGIINDRAMGEIQLGIGLSPYFSIAIDAPVVMWQQGYEPSSADNPNQINPLVASGMSDIRITPKLALLDLDKLPVGVAVIGEMTVPTNHGGGFLSEEEVTGTALIAIEAADSSVRKRQYMIRVAGNAGMRFRKAGRFRDLIVHNEFLYAGAIAIHPIHAIELGVEVVGAIGGESQAHYNLETLPFLKIHTNNNVSITAGGGFGVMPGLGTPDYRGFLGASFAPIFDPASRDSDRDGIANKFDICVNEPEDLDEYQDDDGCPDIDNDKDDILDSDDLCMYEPEDRDGHEDLDGCPDIDNDKDGILDISDRCPDEPEVFNGFNDDDGCPDKEPVKDTDGDGYDDDVDRCPKDPEDFDGIEDEDGCPEKDPVAYIDKNQIKITDKIHFETDKAVIREISFDLISSIADLLSVNPDLLLVRIEGHTDNMGDELYNIRLSQNRATSVKQFLINLGIDASRLDAAGFGEARPIDTNETEAGKAANRRVEFLIIDRE
jgi:outer membrane protein OmpA-like peptidoglycan-associated protein